MGCTLSDFYTFNFDIKSCNQSHEAYVRALQYIETSIVGDYGFYHVRQPILFIYFSLLNLTPGLIA